MTPAEADFENIFPCFGDFVFFCKHRSAGMRTYAAYRKIQTNVDELVIRKLEIVFGIAKLRRRIRID